MTSRRLLLPLIAGCAAFGFGIAPPSRSGDPGQGEAAPPDRLSGRT